MSCTVEPSEPRSLIAASPKSIPSVETLSIATTRSPGSKPASAAGVLGAGVTIVNCRQYRVITTQVAKRQYEVDRSLPVHC
ncbi:hypothetical protein [Chroococcidiopsis sp. CCMEE 29]|uniref:hypothetical protein n=1 Tax=Chroococcidiopsis sp. CCMEE 29 TaxID=155894 RepID=UPI0020221AA1|nr:hypothetical protein [Chroococcidiopsis sp. CCMEE 29]